MSKPAKTDAWGEPLPAPRRIFSLAALFRAMTGVALMLGWLSVVRTAPTAAPHMLVAVAIVLSAVAGFRQGGSLWRRGLTSGLFFGGVIAVGAYSAGLYLAFWPPDQLESTPQARETAAVAGSCLGLLLWPTVAVLFIALVRTWLHLATDAAVRKKAKDG